MRRNRLAESLLVGGLPLMIMMRSTSTLLGLIAVGSILAACGQSEVDPGVATSLHDSSTTAVQTSASVTAVDETTPASSEALEACEGCEPAAIDPSWIVSSRPWFAYDVVPDTTLAVLVEPQFGADTVAELRADTVGLVAFEADVDGWMPIAVGDGAGWVPSSFLRPLAAVDPPVIVGSPPTGVAAIAREVVASLSDGSALSALLGPKGMVISLDAEITDADITVSASELADPTAEVRNWGQDSHGAAVSLTLDEVLFDLSGSVALTSTERIGFDDPVDAAAVDAVRSAFPNATLVEYHFAGTDTADRADWATLVVVIDVSSGAATPMAVVSATGRP